MGTSIRRYAPPMGTAGLARCFVRGYRRVPAPPPRITAATDLELEIAVGDWPTISSTFTAVALMEFLETLALGATRAALSLEPEKKSLRPTGVLLLWVGKELGRGDRCQSSVVGEGIRAPLSGGIRHNHGEPSLRSITKNDRLWERVPRAHNKNANTHRHADALCANMTADIAVSG